MRVDDERIIDIPLPIVRFERGSFKGLHFKMFHEDVCNDMREGRVHGRAFNLFINSTLVAKKVDSRKILIRLVMSRSTIFLESTFFSYQG